MNKPLQKAVLVGIQLPKMSTAELDSSMAELTRLVTTLGYEVVGRVTQKRSTEKSATVLGEGKLQELSRWTGGTGVVAALFKPIKTKAAIKREEEAAEALAEIEENEADEADLEGEEDIDLQDTDDITRDSDSDDESESDDDDSGNDSKDGDSDDDEEIAEITGDADIIIVDADLSPSQLRNLESAGGAPVLDRTGVIIEIFSRHAKTRAARLQVEIARLTYVAPRLRAGATGGDQQGGGGKGAGETKLELDKRNIRDRVKELKTELASIDNEHEVRRARRSQEITVALVGYTNAGKSSLMRALTGSDILVADKLFATLDTTIRPMQPESLPKILISDTVGFIKKLPHDLVASFKSTLDEALHASLLLYVVDSADPSFRSQYEVTQKVLAEVGAVEAPHLLVMNKRDKLTAAEFAELKAEFPDAVFISTRDKDDLKMIRSKILSYFEGDMIEDNLFIPFQVQGVIGEVRRRARVLNESYSDKGVTLKLRAHPDVFAHFNESIKKSTAPKK